MMSNIFFFILGVIVGFMLMAIIKVGDRDD